MPKTRCRGWSTSELSSNVWKSEISRSCVDQHCLHNRMEQHCETNRPIDRQRVKIRSPKVPVRGADCMDTWLETAERKLCATTNTANPVGGLDQTSKAKASSAQAKAKSSLTSERKRQDCQRQRKEQEQR